MKIASITLPQAYEPASMWSPESSGFRQWDKLNKGHYTITGLLKEKYRGYTKVPAKGVWLDPNGKVFYEDVYRYEFACEDDEQSCSELRALAYNVKTITDEQSIMIVHTNGNVEFI